jgi:predicted RNase H-like HicB family nuclease
MNEKLLKEAKKLANQNYPVIVSKDKVSTGETIFLAKNPDLTGCMAQGNSIEEALESLVDARVDYIYSLLEDEMDVPSPELTETTTLLTSSSFTSVDPSTFTVVRSSLPASEDKIEDDKLYEAFFQSTVTIHG